MLISEDELEALIDVEIEKLRQDYSPDDIGPERAYRYCRDIVMHRLAESEEED